MEKDIRTDDACEAYRQWLLPSLIAKYLPANPTERGLVETIALAGARQDWAIRTSEAYLAQAIEAQANPEAPYKYPGRNTLPLLHRLENRYYRQETHGYFTASVRKRRCGRRRLPYRASRPQLQAGRIHRSGTGRRFACAGCREPVNKPVCYCAAV
jgi:hypothetical protein